MFEGLKNSISCNPPVPSLAGMDKAQVITVDRLDADYFSVAVKNKRLYALAAD